MEYPQGIPEGFIGPSDIFDGIIVLPPRSDPVVLWANAALPVGSLYKCGLTFYFEVCLIRLDDGGDVEIGFWEQQSGPTAAVRYATHTCRGLAVADAFGAGFEPKTETFFFTLNGVVVGEVQRPPSQQPLFPVLCVAPGGGLSLKADFGDNEESSLAFDPARQTPPLHFNPGLLAAHWTQSLVTDLLSPCRLVASAQEGGPEELRIALESMAAAPWSVEAPAGEVAWLQEAVELLSELAAKEASGWTASDDVEGLKERAMDVQRRLVQLTSELDVGGAGTMNGDLMRLHDLVSRTIEQVDFTQAALSSPPSNGTDAQVHSSEAEVCGRSPNARLLQHRILALVCALRSPSPVGKSAATLTIALLARRSEDARRQIVGAGGLHYLLDLVIRCTGDGARAKIQRQAAVAVAFLVPAVDSPTLGRVAGNIVTALGVVLAAVELPAYAATQAVLGAGGAEQRAVAAAAARLAQHIASAGGKKSFALPPPADTSPRRRPRPSGCPANSSNSESAVEKTASGLFDIAVQLEGMCADDVVRERDHRGEEPPRSPLRLRGNNGYLASPVFRELRAAADEETANLLAEAVALLVQNENCRAILVKRGALKLLERWLTCGPAARHAAAAIAALCQAMDVYSRGWIDAQLLSGNILPALLALLSSPQPSSLSTKLHCVEIIHQLSQHPQNRPAIAEAGGVYALGKVVTDAAVALERRDAEHPLSPLSSREVDAWEAPALRALHALFLLSSGGERSAAELMDMRIAGPAVSLARRSGRRPSLPVMLNRLDSDAAVGSQGAQGSPIGRNSSWLLVSRITTTPLRLAAVHILALLSEGGDEACAALAEAGALDVLLAVAVDADPSVLALREEDIGEEKELRQRVSEQGEEAIQAGYALANLAEAPGVAERLNKVNAAEVLVLLCERGLCWNTEVVRQGIRGLVALIPSLLPAAAAESEANRPLERRASNQSPNSSLAGIISAAPAPPTNLAQQVLDRVLKVVTSALESLNSLVQLQALRAMSLLAGYPPFQHAIIGGPVLQVVLSIALDVLSNEDLSELASGVLVSLGFAGGKKDLEVCGNDTNLLRDWWYLMRAIETQRLAEEEIWLTVDLLWLRAFDAADSNSALLQKTQLSDGICGQAVTLSGDVSWRQVRCMLRSPSLALAADVDAQLSLRDYLKQMSTSLAKNWREVVSVPLAEEPVVGRGAPEFWPVRPPFLPPSPALILKGVKTVFLGCTTTNSFQNADEEEDDSLDMTSLNSVRSVSLHSMHDSVSSNGNGDPRLSPPLMTQFVQRDASTHVMLAEAGELSQRVQRVLDTYLPSRLYQMLLVPLAPRGNDPLRPGMLPLSDMCCGGEGWQVPQYRALLMPQRNYFSFGREGRVVAQILSRCAGGAAGELLGSRYAWALVFRDSTFTGEFVDTLIQALLKSTAINSLTFVNRTPDDKANLGYAIGRLPPWVRLLVFDNSLSPQELQLLGSMLSARRRRGWNELAGLAVKNHRGLKTTDFSNLFDALKGSDDAEHAVSGGAGGTASAASATGGAASAASGGSGASGAGEVLLSEKKGEMRAEKALAAFKQGGHITMPLYDVACNKDALAGLKWLDLSGNHLNDTGAAQAISAVRRCPSLCHVNLSNNGVRRAQQLVPAIIEFIQQANSSGGGGGGSGGGGGGSGGVWLRTLLLNSNGIPAEAAARLLNALAADNSLVRLGLAHNEGLGRSAVASALRATLRSNRSLTYMDMRFCGLSDEVLTEALHGLLEAFEPGPTLRFMRLKGNAALSAHNVEMFENELERTRREYFISTYKQRHSFTPAATPVAELSDSGGGSGGGASSIYDPKVDAVLPPLPVAATVDGPDDVPMVAALISPALHVLTVLFAAPLVYHDVAKKRLHGIAQLDFELEREMLTSTFLESGRDIRLAFDYATTKRLRSAITLQTKALHYSGHGHPYYLAFEDGLAGLHPLQPEALRSLCSAGGDTTLKLVFVSACHSRRAADAFAAAGVPHVVCVKLEERLLDVAARSFTSSFYLALACGHTVENAFNIGREAVAADPHVPNSATEREKFLLLPEDGHHDAVIFDAPRLTSRADEKLLSTRNDVSAGTPAAAAAAAASPRHARGVPAHWRNATPDLKHLPPPPGENFCGREVTIYLAIRAIMSKRLVTLVGEAGCGKSTVAVAVAHYVAARRYFRDGVYFIRATGLHNREDFAYAMIDSLAPHLQPLHQLQQQQQHRQQQQQHGGVAGVAAAAAALPGGQLGGVSQRSTLAGMLGDKQCLVIIDGVEAWQAVDDGVGLKLFLDSLFDAAAQLRVFMTTSRHPSKIASAAAAALGGPQESFVTLPPLSLASAVALFARVCPLLRTAYDRQRFTEELVDPEQADLAINMRGLLPSTARILGELGDGNPAEILRRAYEINQDSFEALLELAPQREAAAAADISGIWPPDFGEISVNDAEQEPWEGDGDAEAAEPQQRQQVEVEVQLRQTEERRKEGRDGVEQR